MHEAEQAVVKERKSLAKGLVAGFIAGLAGTLAMRFAERIAQARTQGDAEPQLLSATGGELAVPAKTEAAGTVHWALGGAAGAAYGGLAEFYPAATARRGASFGMALAALTEEGALPTLGMTAGPPPDTMRDRASELTSYAVYGVTTEVVRSLVRKII